MWHFGEEEKCIQDKVHKMKEKETCLDLNVDATIGLILNLNEYNGTAWTGFIWLRIRTSGGSCEHSNEPFGSAK